MPLIELLVKKDKQLGIDFPSIEVYVDDQVPIFLRNYKHSLHEKNHEPIVTVASIEPDFVIVAHNICQAFDRQCIEYPFVFQGKFSMRIAVTPEYSIGEKLERLKEIVRKQAVF